MIPATVIWTTADVVAARELAAKFPSEAAALATVTDISTREVVA